MKELTKLSKILERVEQKSLQKGEQIGIQKGEQIGIQKGREEGRREAQRLIAAALRARGDSVDKVMSITGLTRGEVEALQTHEPAGPA